MKNSLPITMMLMFLTSFSNYVSAQVPTVQDCLNAIPICQDTFMQTTAFTGTGNYPNEITYPLSCLVSGEKNDVWYTFTAQTSDTLNFSITPNDSIDDYDWAVFDLTNNSCSDISTVSNLQVSCNYAGNNCCGGVTGANYHGIAPPIPQYQQSSPVFYVTAGHTYVLNISNYTSSQSGYLLDFSASAAQLYDATSPYLDSINAAFNPGDTVVTVMFSENIYCNTVQLSDFTLTGPGGPYTITAIHGTNCDIGADYGREFTFTFSPPVVMSGTFTLAIVDTLNDLCFLPVILPNYLSAMSSCITFATINPVTCDFYTAPSGNYTWYATGTYSDTIPNSIGCDSILTINLVCNTANTTVVQNGITLTANAPALAWQWIDCDNGFAPISGATGQVFTAPADGNYAVVITQNGCTDTSACYSVTGVGVNEIKNGTTFTLQPNPAKNTVTIITEKTSGATVSISDVTGKIFRSVTFTGKAKIEMDISGLTAGTYLVRIEDDDLIQTQKLIIEK